MPKKTIRKIASAVSAAIRDAEVARRSANDPQFHRDVQKDRRGTLSRFETVQHALRDRAAAERSAKSKAAKSKAAKSKAAKSKAAKKPR